MVPAVFMEEASFGYQDRVVLRGVTLSLPAGAFVALTGDNGSGKTTFLRAVTGLAPLLDGFFCYLDPDKPPVRSEAGAAPTFFTLNPRIGFVSQRDKLDDLYLFSAYEVVCAGARLAGCPGVPVGADAKRRVEAALETAGASEFARVLFSKLSGGQRQRVLFARALALQPEVLVLDEPVSGVDADALAGIATLLETLRDEGRMTIFLASHDPALVARLATHRVRLCDGDAECETLARDSGANSGSFSR
jgi:ABC-type Mn2+/Zn2+ transport system ATPase subunit